MINQYNNGRYHHSFGGVSSLNRFMGSSGYVHLGGGQFADLSGRNVGFNEVFNNYILPNSLFLQGTAAQHFYARIQQIYHPRHDNQYENLIADNNHHSETAGLDFNADDPPGINSKSDVDAEARKFRQAFQEYMNKGYIYITDDGAMSLFDSFYSDLMYASLSIKVGAAALKVKELAIPAFMFATVSGLFSLNSSYLEHLYRTHGMRKGIFAKSFWTEQRLRFGGGFWYTEFRYGKDGSFMGVSPFFYWK
jgi:hypothetical protein